MSRGTETNISLILKIVGGVIVLIVGLWFFGSTFTTVGADEIVIKQDIVGGKLNVWNTPGVHMQNFGTITRYKRSAQLWFSEKEDEGKKSDESIKVRFNDGGHGNISGSLRYTLPINPDQMIALHQTYHSMESIDHELATGEAGVAHGPTDHEAAGRVDQRELVDLGDPLGLAFKGARG